MGIKGQVGLWNQYSIVGWILSSGRGGHDCEQPIELEVVLDGQVIARLLADTHRPDVAQATGSHGNCGFVFDFPPEIDRPARTRARLRFAGSNLYIEPSVRPVPQPEEQPRATNSPMPASPGAFTRQT